MSALSTISGLASSHRNFFMLKYALLFSLLSLFAAGLGFGDIAMDISSVVNTADIAQTASALFLVMTLLFALLALGSSKTVNAVCK